MAHILYNLKKKIFFNLHFWKKRKNIDRRIFMSAVMYLFIREDGDRKWYIRESPLHISQSLGSSNRTPMPDCDIEDCLLSHSRKKKKINIHTSPSSRSTSLAGFDFVAHIKEHYGIDVTFVTVKCWLDRYLPPRTHRLPLEYC